MARVRVCSGRIVYIYFVKTLEEHDVKVRVREEIEGLHCGLHSDYIVRRESFLVTSDVK